MAPQLPPRTPSVTKEADSSCATKTRHLHALATGHTAPEGRKLIVERVETCRCKWGRVGPHFEVTEGIGMRQPQKLEVVPRGGKPTNVIIVRRNRSGNCHTRCAVDRRIRPGRMHPCWCGWQCLRPDQRKNSGARL